MTNLENKLLLWQDAYYNSEPLVPDSIYDAAYDELRRTNPDSFVLKIVGASPKSGWPKAYHRIPMGSLDKVNTVPEFNKWFPDVPCVVSEKLDGISVAVEYNNGKFVRAITRGRDNEPGEVITRNVSLMQGVPKAIPNNSSEIWVRGEIILNKQNFETYFNGSSNPRNCASGVARREGDGYEECQYLTLMSYRIYNLNGKLATSRLNEFEILKEYGFNVPFFKFVNNAKDVENIYNEYIDTRRSTLNYDIDGLVIDVNSLELAEELGEVNNRPKGSIAFKFPHETAVTTLRDIRWQVGNSGRVTPVGLFDAVQLAGANVEKATLHNAGRVEHLKLSKDCSILVSRRNDCIPAIEANLTLGIIVDD